MASTLVFQQLNLEGSVVEKPNGQFVVEVHYKKSSRKYSRLIDDTYLKRMKCRLDLSEASQMLQSVFRGDPGGELTTRVGFATEVRVDEEGKSLEEAAHQELSDTPDDDSDCLVLVLTYAFQFGFRKKEMSDIYILTLQDPDQMNQKLHGRIEQLEAENLSLSESLRRFQEEYRKTSAENKKKFDALAKKCTSLDEDIGTRDAGIRDEMNNFRSIIHSQRDIYRTLRTDLKKQIVELEQKSSTDSEEIKQLSEKFQEFPDLVSQDSHNMLKKFNVLQKKVFGKTTNVERTLKSEQHKANVLSRRMDTVESTSFDVNRSRDFQSLELKYGKLSAQVELMREVSRAGPSEASISSLWEHIAKITLTIQEVKDLIHAKKVESEIDSTTGGTRRDPDPPAQSQPEPPKQKEDPAQSQPGQDQSQPGAAKPNEADSNNNDAKPSGNNSCGSRKVGYSTMFRMGSEVEVNLNGTWYSRGVIYSYNVPSNTVCVAFPEDSDYGCIRHLDVNSPILAPVGTHAKAIPKCSMGRRILNRKAGEGMFRIGSKLDVFQEGKWYSGGEIVDVHISSNEVSSNEVSLIFTVDWEYGCIDHVDVNSPMLAPAGTYPKAVPKRPVSIWEYGY
eukprot:841611_1